MMGTFSVKSAAALDFEPWKCRLGEWTPPSNEEWARSANPYLVTIRVACVVVHKTKPEVMKFVEKMDNNAGSAVMNGFVDTISFFKGVLALLEAAEARILVAGSAVEVAER